MFLVTVDAHSKWIEVFPTKGSCSQTGTISKHHPLFARLGLPEMIVSENGTAFTNAEFRECIKKNGMRHLTSASYHAASKGLAEGTVQTIKRGLLKQTAGEVDTRLSRFLFNYRTTLRDLPCASDVKATFANKIWTIATVNYVTFPVLLKHSRHLRFWPATVCYRCTCFHTACTF